MPGAKGITSSVSTDARKATAGARVKTGTSTPRGEKSSLESTFRPAMVEARVPHGPVRLGPRRRFIMAMIFSSMKMITKAAGTVNSRMPVAAAMKRRISMLD